MEREKLGEKKRTKRGRETEKRYKLRDRDIER